VDKINGNNFNKSNIPSFVHSGVQNIPQASRSTLIPRKVKLLHRCSKQGDFITMDLVSNGDECNASKGESLVPISFCVLVNCKIPWIFH